MDSFEYSVLLIDIDAGNSDEVHVCNSPVEFLHGLHIYRPCPELEVNVQALTGDFTPAETKITNLNSSFPVLAGLAKNDPYSKVSVIIREVFLDKDEVEVGVEYLFRGYVYQSKPKRKDRVIELVLKDDKYYTDTTAGIPCTELCAAPYFGDPYICTKTVHSEPHTVTDVTGYQITLDSPLLDTTAFLFNGGYIENGAQRIKIKHHQSGLVFQMSRRVPDDWNGASVTLYAGCDRQLSTCRDVHSNEERFLGLGCSMVDYNPLYETN